MQWSGWGMTGLALGRKRGWEESRARRGWGKASSAIWVGYGSREEEEPNRAKRFDQTEWVSAVAINCDEEDRYCRWLGEVQEFCFGHVNSEIPSDMRMEKSERQGAGNIWAQCGGQSWRHPQGINFDRLSLKPQTGEVSGVSHAGHSYRRRGQRRVSLLRRREKTQGGGRWESWRSVSAQQSLQMTRKHKFVKNHLFGRSCGCVRPGKD